ncbi:MULTISPECIES: LysR family transcriptional regulator [unclassified Variovorax]|uniref:LysR family transcriptional regulator n=1 Tax=unclassified Variovorax TaxID=663243 RepID=UPI000BE3C0B4|nr:LysR family transcriptional regulator [Variovorax sp. YR752]
MTFDLQQLRAFTTVVAAGSLGRASAVLNVTQSALSRTIQRLEESVGAALFERHSKGMQLTDIGRALLPRANWLQQEARAAREEIDAMRGLAKGTIRVGAVSSVACSVLPTAIGNFLGRWPHLKVQVLEGFWDRLAAALVQNEIDLALAPCLPDTEEIEAVQDCRWTDASYVVAARNHPLRSRQALSYSDLLEQRWVLPGKGSEPYNQFERTVAGQGLAMPEMVVDTRSVLVMKNLVARFGFLGWMNEPMFETERQAGLFDTLPIEGITSRRDLTAFRRRVGMLPGPAAKFLDELRALAEASGQSAARPSSRSPGPMSI